MSLDPYSSIKALANELREEISLPGGFECYTKIAASAYDTAWVAMVEDPNVRPGQPMFVECLEWILQNQKAEGYWGECDPDGVPTLDTLTGTLACVCALNKWNLGSPNIRKGLSYVLENTKKLLEIHSEKLFPTWFVIIFPAMVELAAVEVGLHFPYSPTLKSTLMELSYKCQQILQSENPVEKKEYPPLAFLEALPSTYDLKKEEIVKHIGADGSLFQSPSATARAFMLTRNNNCLSYLQSLVKSCPHGVPMTYPMDTDLMKLSMVNEIQRMGLTEHFSQDIDATLQLVHSNYKNQMHKQKAIGSIAADLYKDSLAFRLLRMHGFCVSPQIFCWFQNDDDIQEHIQRNHNDLWGALLNVHRATDLAFQGENELEDVRSFSRNLLEKSMFQKMIKHELSSPWIARMEHLEHRQWIEHHSSDTLCVAKAGHYRWSSSFIYKLKQLARKNFEFRQSVYQQELEELERWTREKGLTDLGFARNKTVNLYFAMATSTSFPHDSAIRKILTKSAILVVTIDDFFDVGGSLEELQVLTDALNRWDPEGLSGNSKILFDALDDLVEDISQHLRPEEYDQIDNIRNIWFETLVSWLKEAVWMGKGIIPSMDEYLENARISVAVHAIALPSSCLLNPSIPSEKMKPTNYDALTKQVMISCRLLNDIRSYKREQEEGKQNSVSLHLRENPNAKLTDSIANIQGIIETTRKDILEHALMFGQSDLPRLCKHLHLSCYRFFEMFYGSSNRLDSKTDLLQDIQKAIYLPLDAEAPKQLTKPRAKLHLIPPRSSYYSNLKSKKYNRANSRMNLPFQPTYGTTFLVSAHPISISLKMSATTNIQMPMIHKPSFI